MGKQNFKTKKILVIALICVIFVASLIIGLLLFNDHDVIEDRIASDNELPYETIDGNHTMEDDIEGVLQEEIDNKDDLGEEKYSVIFLDSDGQILQSSYFNKEQHHIMLENHFHLNLVNLIHGFHQYLQ